MKKLFLIFTFTLVSFLFSSFVLAQPAETNVQTEVKNPSPIYFTPNVPIPCFFEGTIQITPNSIATYINAVYRYGAGLAGVIAMFMIVFAAWQWIIAAGNAGKIENAKETIIGALIGLALLFGGYLLLAQISSRLVELKGLDITHIDTKLRDSIEYMACPNTIYINCGQVVVMDTGARCMGSKCASGQQCHMVTNGLVTRNFCNPDSTNPCSCVADDYEYPEEHSCESITDSGLACLNDITATNGPCRWDPDGLAPHCVNVESHACGDNSECIIYPSEDVNNSQYCCCNISYLDQCVERGLCGADCYY